MKLQTTRVKEIIDDLLDCDSIRDQRAVVADLTDFELGETHSRLQTLYIHAVGLGALANSKFIDGNLVVAAHQKQIRATGSALEAVNQQRARRSAEAAA